MEDGLQDPRQEPLGEVAALRSEIQELKRRERKYMQEIAESENEFGKKRALFKELYVTREEELKREKSNAQRAREEAEKLKEELQNMVAENDGFRTAAALSQQDELEAIHLKHQDEIASLQHIMRETVRDAENIAAQKFQEERHQFVSKIQTLQAQIAELHNKQSHGGEGTGQSANVLSSAMSAVSNAVRRNTSSAGNPPSATSDEISEDEVLELSMRKAQEDAEAWRAIVMPLEQEISTLKAKLKDSQKKLQLAEAKIKASPDKIKKKGPGSELELGKTSAPAEDQDEKVKELSQYLEAERSSRTDLEMYVAVLNTQKGVLQEDADKLRKEMHQVCRLLEQERTAHRELKQTWQLANDQFLENQRLQDIELQRVCSVLTAEQMRRIEALRQNEPDVGQLISFDSPDASPSTTSLEASDAPLSLPTPSSSMWDSISTVPCTSALASSSAGSIEKQNESEAAGVRRVHSASDVNSLDDSSGEISKTKSADNLLSPAVSPTPEPSSENRDATDAVSTPREFPQQGTLGTRVRVGSAGGKIDWKIFQEAVKVSHQSDMSRNCAMCVNYERQLQEMQKFQNLSSNLQRALEQEKKALFEEQKQRRRLEESITRAAEDAQAQINLHVATHTKLERLLTGAKEKFDATRREAHSRIEDLVRSRNELEAELNKLKTDYSSLQDNAIQQLSQMDSDARVSEMKEQLMQIRAAAENTEDKLRSEIAFLKDRAMAEQMAKDSLEEMYQGDVDGLRADLGKAKDELAREARNKLEVESNLIKAQQSQKNVERKSQQVIIALRGQVDDANEEKINMEQENKKLKNQLQSLNQQLNESEAVQKDFVRLSQSLQMQIASIQESESEVRWVHPDDASECRKCKKQLNSRTEKHHCDHCGKIFCTECLSQTVHRFTSNRAHRVCDTCHTSLNKESKSTFFDTNLADSHT